MLLDDHDIDVFMTPTAAGRENCASEWSLAPGACAWPRISGTFSQAAGNSKWQL